MERTDGMSRAVASMPWQYSASRPSKATVGPSARIPRLHYRGWTLVDFGRSRYATEDATGRRVRVCDEGEHPEVAIRRFHEVVDREVDGEIDG